MTRRYGRSGPGSHVPFRITGRGVLLRGELKGMKPVSVGKPKREQPRGESLGLKGPGVTRVRLETG